MSCNKHLVSQLLCRLTNQVFVTATVPDGAVTFPFFPVEA